jgi:hypothetical protein
MIVVCPGFYKKTVALSPLVSTLDRCHWPPPKNVQVKKIHLHKVTEEVTSLLLDDVLCLYKMTSQYD